MLTTETKNPQTKLPKISKRVLKHAVQVRLKNTPKNGQTYNVWRDQRTKGKSTLKIHKAYNIFFAKVPKILEHAFVETYEVKKTLEEQEEHSLRHKSTEENNKKKLRAETNAK